MSRLSHSAVAEVFSALGEKTRLSILSQLRGTELSATHLSENAKVTRQAIVKHLQILERAGLVECEKHGRDVLYTLKPERLDEAKNYLDMVSIGWDQALERLRKMVED